MELKRAFAMLSTCRQFGAVISPIPFTAVWGWMNDQGIFDPALRRHIEEVMSIVDNDAIRKSIAAAKEGAKPKGDKRDRMGGESKPVRKPKRTRSKR